MTAARFLSHRCRCTTGPGTARLPQVGCRADGAAVGRGSARPLSSWWRAGRGPGVMAGEPVSTPLLRFPSVSRKCASATPVPSEHSSYFGNGEKKSSQSCPVSVLSLGWARSFSLGLGLQKWGEPGLAPPLGLLRLSDTLLGKTRGIREGSEKRVSAPSQRRGTSPGASK